MSALPVDPTTVTMPGHDEPLRCGWCGERAHVAAFTYAGVPITGCPAIPQHYVAYECFAVGP